MTDPEPHVCFSCVEFEDGSAEAMLLQVGTLEECKRVQERIPAVAYGGDKTVKEAFLGISTHEKWCKASAKIVVLNALDEKGTPA